MRQALHAARYPKVGGASVGRVAGTTCREFRVGSDGNEAMVLFVHASLGLVGRGQHGIGDLDLHLPFTLNKIKSL